MKLLAYVLAALATAVNAKYTLNISTSDPLQITVNSGSDVIVSNTAVLTGIQNTTTQPISISSDGSIQGQHGTLAARFIRPTVVKVQVKSSDPFVGARFMDTEEALYYGTFEYPWSGKITNENVSFDLKGVGNNDGINWSNARAPFYFSDAGYGVYADTLDMGSYNFSAPGNVQFIFNTSSLTYYIILPEAEGDFKSIIEQYADLSSTIELPAISGYGPTFWSDDFEQDFHDGVTNAQENYYDVINHLYYNQIRATAMFADRPYGTGNMAFGNFDFDPVYYPTPAEFIANLTAYGFDFQVWVANRAFEQTELYNTSIANGWLFPNQEPAQGGPALNLSIPEAYKYFKQRLSFFPNLGVKGYKIDRGEEEEMPVFEQNIQMSLFEQLCYESMESKWGEGGFYNFARSVVDRSRSRTAVWNGDSQSNWTGLAYSVASGIRAGLIGFPIWSSDTGGYVRNADDPAEDLWARWMWFSAFSPAYEIMIGTNHTPWYPPYTSNLVSILKQTANLHHDLLPYILSYAKQAEKTGLPIMRALFLEAPNDKGTYHSGDEYFFGSEFLVAPIVASGDSRIVYFPEGSYYLEYFGKTSVYSGGGFSDITNVGLDSVPVYVRRGAIVPRGDVYQGNNKWTKDWKPSLTIELYPSYAVNASSFAYYNADEDRTVNIAMTTDEDSKTVEVTYGKLGYSGEIVFYVKGGEKTMAIHPDGGTLSLEDVDCLF